MPSLMFSSQYLIPRLVSPTIHLTAYAHLTHPTHLTGAEPERVIKEIEDIIGLDCSNILRVSAKQGIGIEETLEAIVDRIPPPRNTINSECNNVGNAWLLRACKWDCRVQFCSPQHEQ